MMIRFIRPPPLRKSRHQLRRARGDASSRADFSTVISSGAPPLSDESPPKEKPIESNVGSANNSNNVFEPATSAATVNFFNVDEVAGLVNGRDPPLFPAPQCHFRYFPGAWALPAPGHPSLFCISMNIHHRPPDTPHGPKFWRHHPRVALRSLGLSTISHEASPPRKKVSNFSVVQPNVAERNSPCRC